MSAHPNATLRDSTKSPICPPPFDINHALWRFSQTPRQRVTFSGREIARQIGMFHGNTVADKRANMRRLSRAYYDFVKVQSIDKIMNCTCIDNDTELILETITLPF